MVALWFPSEQFPNFWTHQRWFSLLPTPSYNQLTFPAMSIREKCSHTSDRERPDLKPMLIHTVLGEMPPRATEAISPRPGRAGRMKDGLDQLHLISWVRKPRPAIRNDMPSGLWFTNMVINIGSELGLEVSMSPQRRSVKVWRFVCVGVLFGFI